jgi:hypothetical protein
MFFLNMFGLGVALVYKSQSEGCVHLGNPWWYASLFG